MKEISRLVVFGDSNSDIGKTFELSKGTSPGPYNYKGRYSDGPVWSDLISKRHGLSYENTCYGGATINNENVMRIITVESSEVEVPGMKQQIQEYISNLKSKAATSESEHTLYTAFVGGNDFTAYLSPEKFRSFHPQSEKEKAEEIGRIISSLLIEELKAETVLVIGTRPKAYYPPIVQEYDEEKRAEIDRETVAFNTHLEKVCQHLTLASEQKQKNENGTMSKKTNVLFYDIYGLMEDMRKNPKKFGINENMLMTYQEIMLDTEKNRNSSLELSQPLTEDISNLMFWDGFHLGSTSHGILSDEIEKFLKSNEIIFSSS
ncbi:hypothetical protein BB560_004448 [Smittium megazygosporum]|uniref:SGNH hydrolase-type esterase domain-containing protein n=1 Tax=Smittium megazygosporum TaxID=133381 RepID=A0A2T9Z9B0_9FUNG|nr:hypothetical protein BB560_004448 [Smittium megazygosporum]